MGRAVKNAGHTWLSSASGGAWLWDGTAQTRRGGTLINVPVMLESEWGGWDAIKYDFEKLMVARAAPPRHRLFRLYAREPKKPFQTSYRWLRAFEAASAQTDTLLLAGSDRPERLATSYSGHTLWGDAVGAEVRALLIDACII